MKTQANITIWGLLLASTSCLECPGKVEVTMVTTQEELVALIMPTKPKKLEITFTNEDLQPKVLWHNKPLHVLIKCLEKWVLILLVDNESVLNICPLKVSYALDLGLADYKPSNQGVRAYKNTWRSVIGIIHMPIVVEDVATIKEFQVLDVLSTFNLLLGRPWLHPLEVVPSIIHQKIKMIRNDAILTWD